MHTVYIIQLFTAIFLFALYLQSSPGKSMETAGVYLSNPADVSELYNHARYMYM